jgi:hypothetical protein|nr:hypothetical protein [uncultured Mediterranean phage uvMED]
MTYKKEKFIDGDFKGFSFFTPVFESLDEVVESYGDKTLLALVNQQVQTRIRAKVKNSLPKNLPTSELERYKDELYRKHPDGTLLTQDEANEWTPSLKELSARKLFLLAQAEFAKGNKETAENYMDQCKSKTLQ